MHTIINNNYWTPLSQTRPFELVSNLLDQKGILPSSINMNGNKELLFDFEYRGKDVIICCHAIWDFRWHRFYFVLNTRPLHSKKSSFESPFLTEREFLSEIDILEKNQNFKRKETNNRLNDQDCDFIINECRF